jgi:hypothetical protein
VVFVVGVCDVFCEGKFSVAGGVGIGVCIK